MKLLGLLLVLAGIAGFFWSAPKMDVIRSGLGQLGIAFGGQQAQNEANMYQNAYYGSIAIGVGGFAFLIAGFAQKKSKSAV